MHTTASHLSRKFTCPQNAQRVKMIKTKIYSVFPTWILEDRFFFKRADTRKIKNLKGKFNGQRCFIIGNGPSLDKHDLSFLKNEHSFAVNGIFYKSEICGFTPTFYVVEDYCFMNENIEKIQSVKARYKFFPINYRHLLKNKKNTLFFRMNTGFYVKESPNFCVPRFSIDMSYKLYCGQSVTILNLQIAYYLGFSEVYLIGMDFDYKIPKSAIINGDRILSTESDSNHFHPEYFGKGKTWHNPHIDRVLLSYKMAKLMYELNNRKIYNATIGGKLEVFERVNYNKLFGNGSNL